jgi:predicted RNA-binding protein with PIN domain
VSRQNRKPKSNRPRRNKNSRDAVSPGLRHSEIRPLLIVDGHSVIFGWPDLCALHKRRSSMAREVLIKRLRDYQDWTGVRVVVVFDGRGPKVTQLSDAGEIEIFYSRAGQTADTVIERLASKYAARFDLTVATSDYLEQQTVTASGAACISNDTLRGLLKDLRLP